MSKKIIKDSKIKSKITIKQVELLINEKNELHEIKELLKRVSDVLEAPEFTSLDKHARSIMKRLECFEYAANLPKYEKPKDDNYSFFCFLLLTFICGLVIRYVIF